MIKKDIPLIRNTTWTRNMKTIGGLPGILITFTPIILLGIYGTRLGSGTFLGGLLINNGLSNSKYDFMLISKPINVNTSPKVSASDL